VFDVLPISHLALYSISQPLLTISHNTAPHWHTTHLGGREHKHNIISRVVLSLPSDYKYRWSDAAFWY